MASRLNPYLGTEFTVAIMSSSNEPCVQLRPGVFRPDWKAVTTQPSRRALLARSASRSGLVEAWARPLEPRADLLWRAAVQGFAAAGRPPALAALAAQTGLTTGQAMMLLRDLAERDLVGLTADGEGVAYAYPFTAARSGHAVQLGAKRLNALCAVDALGVAAMCQSDVVVDSACRHCGAAIRVETLERGQAIANASALTAVVWYDFSYCSSAAASCCPNIAFFCCDAHLDAWRGRAPSQAGQRLSLPEALEVGRALFAPVLAAGL